MKLPFHKVLRSEIVDHSKKSINYGLRTKNWRQRRLGFSLIELLVVISIIAILVAAATVSWTNAQQKSRDSKRKSDVKAVQQALELYLQDNGTYPRAASGLIQCPGLPPTDIAWGGDFTCNSKTYMNPLPKDPRGGSDSSLTFVYDYHPDSTTYLKYQLNAALENSKDPEYCTDSSTCAQLPCAPNNPAKSNGNKSYCVINP